MSEERSPISPALAYARSLHEDLVAANRDMYIRAQVVLTLDGLVVSVVGAVVSAAPEDVAKSAALSGPIVGSMVLLALALLAISVTCALLALYVRHRTGAEPGSSVGVNHLWFWGRIAEVDPVSFQKVARKMTEELETEVRLRQVTVMARIMNTRAGWTNRAYGAAAASFVLFIAASALHLARLA